MEVASSVIMLETIYLDEIVIGVVFKNVRMLRLSVQPSDGHVRLVVPLGMSLEIAQAFATSKLAWIRAKRQGFSGRFRELPPQFVQGERHYLWGQPYTLRVIERPVKPSVRFDHSGIVLSVRPGSDLDKRAEVFQGWQRFLLHEVVPDLIKYWETTMGVKSKRYFLQRMKTRWGSCNPRAGHIRLNTELVKRPKDLLEYVVVHELAHLRVPNHGQRFVALLDRHYPCWREAHATLSQQLPTVVPGLPELASMPS